MKEPDYQQRIHQLEGALRESVEREVGLQGRLEEAEVELKHTRTEVADLHQRVEKGQRDLRQSRRSEVDLKVRLEEATSEVIEAKTAGYVFTGSDKKRRASCEGEQDEGDGLAGKAGGGRSRVETY